MIQTKLPLLPLQIKFFFLLATAVLCASCSTNPATGESQFTALMSPQEEVRVGAAEHEKIVEQFGLYDDPELSAYVQEIGARVAQKTERPDVEYRFYVLDTPIVNAFALPGGYVYVSRGLLALANDEAELAGVLGHEVGHITGRHSAERYSQSVVTQLGVSVLSVVLDQPGVDDALNLGSNLYLSSYSRGQESEADNLGMRYLVRAGYDPQASPDFLSALHQHTNVQDKIAGKKTNGYSYFATHPATQDRVVQMQAEARAVSSQDATHRARETYLQKIAGLPYSDSAKQGFMREKNFYHPDIGFTFTLDDGVELINRPQNIVIKGNDSKAVMIFDMAAAKGLSPARYLAEKWVPKKDLADLAEMKVHGQDAATASFSGTVNGQEANIRLIAIAWGDGKFARFQIAIPTGTSAAQREALRDTAYSFRALSETERRNIKPYQVKIVKAKAGDTITSLAKKQPFDKWGEERFSALNNLLPNEGLVQGRSYKVVE